MEIEDIDKVECSKYNRNHTSCQSNRDATFNDAAEFVFSLSSVRFV